jgi:hypothetical protein
MESEVLAYVVSNDGVICHLPVTSELLSLLEQLKQGGAKGRRGGPDEGAIVGELAQALKRAMHPLVSLACEDSSQEDARGDTRQFLLFGQALKSDVSLSVGTWTGEDALPLDPQGHTEACEWFEG